MLLVLSFASPGQIQLLGWRLPRLLDESVEQDDLVRRKHEQQEDTVVNSAPSGKSSA
jgi:hypothetical protein